MTRLKFEPLESRHLLTAVVIQVTTTADTVDPLDGVTSLREAVLQANASPDDNEIQLPAGEYTLTRKGANEDAALTGDLDVLSSGSLQIVGAGAGNTIIDASGLVDASAGYGDAIFEARTGATLNLIGLTLTGANPQNHTGAIRNLGGQMSITACTVTANAGSGIDNSGEMVVTGSTISTNLGIGIINSKNMTIVASTISNNAQGGVSNSRQMTIAASTIAHNTGHNFGGISTGGNLTITASSVVGNSSDAGGGGIFAGGVLSVTNTVVSGNTAATNGGGIWNRGTATITDCKIGDNSATLGGGLYSTEEIHINNSTITGNVGRGVYTSVRAIIAGSTISGNTAVDGAGIHSSGTITVTDSAIFGNSATNRGGGVYDTIITLTNSTISENVAGTQGGGVWGSITLTNGEISHNSAGTQGGGVYGGITLTNGKVSNNSAGTQGGGVYGGITITNGMLSDNLAGTEGGGVYCPSTYDFLTATNSEFLDNVAGTQGGGIYNAGRLNFTNGTLSGNSAADGGAIFNNSSQSFFVPSVSNSTLSANHANNSGGAIANVGSGLFTLVNSTLSGNTANAFGGGIYNDSPSSGPRSNLNLMLSTITSNRAALGGVGQGGGLYLSNRSVTSLNSVIVAGNFRGESLSETASDIERVAGANLVAAFSLIGDPNTAGGLPAGVNGNIIGDGQGHALDIHSILDATLADNGGTTLTHRLVSSSPAIDAGRPAIDLSILGNPPFYDQRGVGFPRVVNGRVDMGAVEFAPQPSSIAGRHIFYDDSAFDDNTAGANATDLFAVATDKQPLLPGGGLTSAANATSYSNGINGIMVDIAGSHPDITAADFLFHVGNNNSPNSWALAPTPASVTVLAGQGDGGSDRVVITWPSGSIKNTWLQVQVLATGHTGLAASDVFYWGNKVGESFTNPSAEAFNTTTADAAQVFANLGDSKPVTDLRDYDRDGEVTTADATLVFANLGNLVRLNIPTPAQLTVEASSPAPAVVSDAGSSAVASALAVRAEQASTSIGTAPQIGIPLLPSTVPSRDRFFADLSRDKEIIAEGADQDDRLVDSFTDDQADDSADELALVLLGHE